MLENISQFAYIEGMYTHTHTHTHTHSHTNLLEIINKYSKFAEYKINIQKLVAFLYTNNELAEREIK